MPMSWGSGFLGLNTLSGGHPLRTGGPGRGVGDDRVSIPSQAGTLFGLGYIERPGGYQYVSIPSQAGTLFGPSKPAIFGPPSG